MGFVMSKEIKDVPASERPLSEQFRIVARKYCDADAAATLMEQLKSTTLEGLKAKIMQNCDGNIADNASERMAKNDPEWVKYVKDMCAHRAKASKLKVQLEYIKMRSMEQQSAEANARAERKM